MSETVNRSGGIRNPAPGTPGTEMLYGKTSPLRQHATVSSANDDAAIHHLIEWAEPMRQQDGDGRIHFSALSSGLMARGSGPVVEVASVRLEAAQIKAGDPLLADIGQYRNTELPEEERQEGFRNAATRLRRIRKVRVEFGRFSLDRTLLDPERSWRWREWYDYRPLNGLDGIRDEQLPRGLGEAALQNMPDETTLDGWFEPPLAFEEWPVSISPEGETVYMPRLAVPRAYITEVIATAGMPLRFLPEFNGGSGAEPAAA